MPKKRHTKTATVLVRMTPELKRKLNKEAMRRGETPSTLARMLIAEALMLVDGINGAVSRIQKNRKRRTHGRR